MTAIASSGSAFVKPTLSKRFTEVESDDRIITERSGELLVQLRVIRSRRACPVENGLLTAAAAIAQKPCLDRSRARSR
jgi:hypothetical protein